jgi:hypothetical protein
MKTYQIKNKSGETKIVTEDELVDYGLSPEMKSGGSIKIKPSKKGTFKAQATKMGMGVQEAASKILNAPEGKYSPEMRKKANFARNFAKQDGGEIEYNEEEFYYPYMGEEMKSGGMLKRADGSYSKRGLWDNIRANKGSGKKPTKAMLKQEKKIRAAEKAYGGYMKDGGGIDNPGFNALPYYVQQNIIDNMAMGGYMESGGKLPTEILRARLESHMSPNETNDYLSEYGMGGYLPKALGGVRVPKNKTIYEDVYNQGNTQSSNTGLGYNPYPLKYKKAPTIQTPDMSLPGSKNTSQATDQNGVPTQFSNYYSNLNMNDAAQTIANQASKNPSKPQYYKFKSLPSYVNPMTNDRDLNEAIGGLNTAIAGATRLGMNSDKQGNKKLFGTPWQLGYSEYNNPVSIDNTAEKWYTPTARYGMHLPMAADGIDLGQNTTGVDMFSNDPIGAQQSQGYLQAPAVQNQYQVDPNQGQQMINEEPSSQDQYYNPNDNQPQQNQLQQNQTKKKRKTFDELRKTDKGYNTLSGLQLAGGVGTFGTNVAESALNRIGTYGENQRANTTKSEYFRQAAAYKGSNYRPLNSQYDKNALSAAYGRMIPEGTDEIDTKFTGLSHENGGIPIDPDKQGFNANDTKTNRNNAKIEVEGGEYYLKNIKKLSKGGNSNEKSSDFILSQRKMGGNKKSHSQMFDDMVKSEIGYTSDQVSKIVNKPAEIYKKTNGKYGTDNISVSSQELSKKLIKPIQQNIINPAKQAIVFDQELTKYNLGMENNLMDLIGQQEQQTQQPMAKYGIKLPKAQSGKSMKDVYPMFKTKIQKETETKKDISLPPPTSEDWYSSIIPNVESRYPDLRRLAEEGATGDAYKGKNFASAVLQETMYDDLLDAIEGKGKYEGLPDSEKKKALGEFKRMWGEYGRVKQNSPGKYPDVLKNIDKWDVNNETIADLKRLRGSFTDAKLERRHLLNPVPADWNKQTPATPITPETPATKETPATPVTKTEYIYEKPEIGFDLSIPLPGNVYGRSPLNYYQIEPDYIDPRYLNILPQLNRNVRSTRALVDNFTNQTGAGIANRLMGQANQMQADSEIYGQKYNYDRAQDAAAQQYNADMKSRTDMFNQGTWFNQLENPIRQREGAIDTQQRTDMQNAIENMRKANAFYTNRNFINDVYKGLQNLTPEQRNAMIFGSNTFPYGNKKTTTKTDEQGNVTTTKTDEVKKHGGKIKLKYKLKRK